jgi:hypothetical protein
MHSKHGVIEYRIQLARVGAIQSVLEVDALSVLGVAYQLVQVEDSLLVRVAGSQSALEGVSRYSVTEVEG